ncbi:zinc finger protein 470-like [Pectinophora gossypiella]|nr:zinc finger protein 470-like [Pectinophora gossypiella]
MSEESDDEPLSALAAAKKLNPEKFALEIIPQTAENEIKLRKKKKLKKTQEFMLNKAGLTIDLARKVKSQLSRPVIQRPADVWLYLKDLNPTGPYSCLLCSEWFINRSKIVVHYILNHKKDFCGICRYFVPDREAWHAHKKFHTPWPCSQCVEDFPTDVDLKQHLSIAHNLVHCRLCHFRLPDNDQYHTHLFQKHNVSNVSSKDGDILWELEFEGCQKFLCLLCCKSNNLSTTFVNHYMGYHHFTLKCFTYLISGSDFPFTVFGADVSQGFIESLKNTQKCGYVDLDHKQTSEAIQQNIIKENENTLRELLSEIKQESVSDVDDAKNENAPEIDKSQLELIKSYKGDEDFDVTLMELVVLQKTYFEYLTGALTAISSNLVPENSDIDYEKAREMIAEVNCSLCPNKYSNIQEFTTHMHKMHSVKMVPIFSCRVCATTFDSQNELDSHISDELGDFEDLWLCQFCDKEFDNRVATRRHLIEHMELLEYDNCFSPHLGFKCKYCPTLFWNEPDRETHHTRVHFPKYKDQYYKCECSELFSDKIWFTHHYLEKHNTDASNLKYLLKCCLCAIVVSSVEQMRTHFVTEHPEARKLFCSLDGCQYRPLSHKKSFNLHLRSQHYSMERKDLACSCSICGREFPNARARSAHTTAVHGPGKFKCKICKELLHSMDERKLHYLLRHPGHHPYECQECGKSFQYKSSLYMHKQDHSPVKKNYTCNICQKVFAKKDSFREHLQIHEGPRHACSYCPMRFVQRSNMLRHERRHTGERPYHCTQCDRTFADKGACTSHLRTHSKEASYACLYCGQTFVQKSKLTYHIRKHTGENLETCTVCSKLFTSACSLREHMKIHQTTNKDGVKCPLCDKKYKDERYMLRHLRTAHSGAHHTCPLCPKSLASPVGLRHHVLTHSRLNMFHCKCCTKSYAVKRTITKHLRRRHGLKGSEINVKDFYRRLDPRELELGLDEDMMTTIFGPPKRVATDILIGDFITFPKKITLPKKPDVTGDGNDEEDDDEETKEEEMESEDEDPPATKETEFANNEAEELEPTDFVSVKIEPMDEEESEASN